MGLLDKLKNGLARTREGLGGRLAGLFSSSESRSADRAVAGAFDGLEETLLSADVGVQVAADLAAGVKKRLRGRRPADLAELKRALGDEIRTIESGAAGGDATAKPRVVFLVGVNGGGKTTTAAKLAHLF